MKKDEHKYCFRVLTDVEDQKWMGTPGIKLRVTAGGIVEGSSVNLTCSSDGDPPVENYTWFKGSSSVGTGGTYSLPNISSEDSGEYTCQSRNELGERRSTAVSLNVLYPPRNVSVSNSSSDEMVNLTCSGDANPPVEIYTWFKEGRSSPVGSGHSYVPLQSGFYYCQAQNQHGAQRSAAVLVNIKGLWVALYAVGGVVGVCALAAFLTGLFCMRRRKKQDVNTDEDIYQNVGDISCPPDEDSSSTHVYGNVESVGHKAPDDDDDDDDYSSIADYENMDGTVKKW
ncbi:B-cell receptor CD22-like [Astyanax mexicanus]|uniref:B-cell receptor CD22-like n=1 Tax=Astyanax mexicanus TaxID=7994 RepID=UPI0020CB0539|nr:B-cell receptor CD22-like [Astyanax mexicanus]